MQTTGNYNCVIRQNNGGALLRRYGTLRLIAEDGKLRGTMFPTMFWQDAPFTDGKIIDDHFCFQVRFSTPCQNFTMRVQGTINGDIITGQVDSPMGIYTLEGTRNTSSDQDLL